VSVPVDKVPAVAVATRREAIEAGFTILATGGNAVDAAIAMSFVMGVVEPYNNGVGGFGEFVYRAPDGVCHIIDAAARAHRGAEPGMFTVIGEPGGLYGWPAVADAANSVGPLAATAPRLVPGLRLAHLRFGQCDWASLVAPAIALAERGPEIDYMSAAVIVHEMATLRRDPLAKQMYFRDGVPPRPPVEERPVRVPNPRLANTLARIAADPDAAMCSGPIVDDMLAVVGRGGQHAFGDADVHDADAVLASDVAPLIEFAGWRVFGSPWASGAVTAAQILGILDQFEELPTLAGTDRYRLIARASYRAFEERLSSLSGSTPPDQVRALLSPEHLGRCAGDIRAADARSHADVVHHAGRATSTTHLSAVDAQGGAVSLTQTLLALFGSHVGVRARGFFLNNAMMWYDPRPGRPNSIAPGRRALSAVSPVVLVSADSSQILTVGAHGARRIITAVAQIVDAIVNLGSTPQQAVDRPRIHVEPSHTDVDERLGEDLVRDLRADGFNASAAHYGPTSLTSARAVAIAADFDARTTATGIDCRSAATWQFGQGRH